MNSKITPGARLFVVFGVPDRDRPNYKIFEEGS